MAPTSTTTEFDHSVTRPNTVKHWVLYTLDSIEAEAHSDDDPVNLAREEGVYPERIYEYAAGDDSIVFSNHWEISSALSKIARMNDNTDDPRPVNRRTDATEWDGPDVHYRYRLTDYGRNVLLDLGVPEKLPNRRDYDAADRDLGVKPAHQPGWWQTDWELFGDEWDARDNDWTATDHPRVYYKDEGATMFENRGYTKIGRKLADVFEGVTFVLTVGPYRSHDLMYAIRDPWRKVVQIDIYSPMAMHRTKEEMQTSFEALVHDLRSGLANAGTDPTPSTDADSAEESV